MTNCETVNRNPFGAKILSCNFWRYVRMSAVVDAKALNGRKGEQKSKKPRVWGFWLGK